MPEGHKTHFLARRHTELIAGHAIRVTSPQGRFRGEARKLSGDVLERVEAFGKHLFYFFSGGQSVHVHLGRYGKFREHVSPPPRPVGKVRMRMIGSEHSLDLTGPTTCRLIDSDAQEAVVARLGPDPLAGGRRKDAWKNVRESGKPIGALLLDQSIIAGVGNIFRAELLFEIGLDPNTRGDELDGDVFNTLWRSLVRMMKTGLKHGKIIAVTSKEVGIPLAKLQSKERLRIYGKTECPRCGGPIQITMIASRKLYWCSSCQRSRGT